MARVPRRARPGEVYVEPFPPTGELHRITTNGDNPLWSPDGKQLFFLTGAPTRQIMAVDINTERGFEALKMTPLPIEGIIAPGPRPYDITPNGKQFLVMIPKAAAAGVTS